MGSRIRFAQLLARTPLHPFLRKLHGKLAWYMDIAGNWHNGDAEVNGERFLLRQAAPHIALALDVGANVGEWTQYLIDRNPNCTVHAFEASPGTFPHLRQRFGGRPNVIPHHLGLAAVQGTLEFNDHGGKSCLSSFVRQAEIDPTPGMRRVTVPVTTVDAFAGDHQLAHIDFVKLDTEGYEMPILRGMEASLAARRISVIQFEYGTFWIDAGETLANAAEFIRRHGYLLFRLRPNSLEPVQYDQRRHECFKYSNFVAVVSPDLLSRWRVPLFQG
ncbi:MAG TPA: FkbM family methyltransferase [Haliangiales bacterium]|nr:FkbM family methyltransferase [Haliangiales bacterium]